MFHCHHISTQNTVLPSAIVTVHSMKDHVIHTLEMSPNHGSVTVFLADVPEGTPLSDSKYKMVDLEKVQYVVSATIVQILQYNTENVAKFFSNNVAGAIGAAGTAMAVLVFDEEQWRSLQLIITTYMHVPYGPS